MADLAQQLLVQTQRANAVERHLHDVLANLKLPTQGWARQSGVLGGYFHDGWIGTAFSAAFRVTRPVRGVRVLFAVPAHASLPMVLRLAVGGAAAERELRQPGEYDCQVGVNLDTGDEAIVSMTCSTSTSGVAAGINKDSRELSVSVAGLVFE